MYEGKNTVKYLRWHEYSEIHPLKIDIKMIKGGAKIQFSLFTVKLSGLSCACNKIQIAIE